MDDSEPISEELEGLEGCFKRSPSRIVDGKHYFIESDINVETHDSLDKIKRAIKGFPQLYRFLMKTISPVLGNDGTIRKFKRISKGTIINLGSGSSPKESGVLNVDLFDYPNVELVCDIQDLPFKDESLDSIMSITVLEHVKDPERVIAEILLKTKNK